MAVTDEVGARLRLKDRPQFSKDAKTAARDVEGIGKSGSKAERESRGAFGRMTGGVKSFGVSALKYGGLAAGALGIAGVAGAFIVGAKSAANYQKITAQTNAVLKSTGGAANVTSAHVKKLADSIEGYSAYSDETVQQGENMLLTFTNIRNGVGKTNQVFDTATQTLMDMTQALGEDPKKAAIQLGKALNDPIKGIGALRKVGVAFTDEQKKQITAMVKSGNTMGAQKVILGELNKEFGGSAKAVGQTFSGSLARAKNKSEDLFRDLATPVLPVFTSLVSKAATGVQKYLVPGLSKATGGAKTFFKAFSTGDVEGGRKGFTGFLQNAGAEAGNFYQTLLHGSDYVAPEAQNGFTKAAALIRSTFKLLWQTLTQDIIPTVKNLWSALMPVSKLVAGILLVGFHAFAVILHSVIGPALRDISGFLKDHKTLLEGVVIVVGTAVVGWKLYQTAIKAWQAITKIATAVQVAFNAVMDANPIVLVIIAIAALAAGIIFAYTHCKTFRNIVHDVFAFIKGFITGTMHVIEAVIKAVWTAVSAVFKFYFNLYKTIVMTAFHVIKATINAVIHAIQAIIRAVWAAVSAIFKFYFNAYKTIVMTVFNFIKGFIERVIRGVQNILHAIMSIINKIWSRDWNLAKSVVTAIWDSIKSVVDKAINWIKGPIDKLVGWFKDIPGKIGSAFSSLASIIESPFKSAFNAIAGFWNSTVGQVHFETPGWLGPLGHKGFSIPKIPTLHEGGIVTIGGLTNIQPNEEIVHLPTGATVEPLPSIGRKPGDDGRPIVIEVKLDRKVIAKAVYRNTQDEEARL